MVQNPSINGNTTRMALDRMAFDVQAHRPDVLIVQFGLNDCNVWESDQGLQRVSPRAFVANLAEIIARARNFGAKEVILGTNHPTTRVRNTMPKCDCTYEDSNRQYNELIRNVAMTHGTRLVDVERAFRTLTSDNNSLSDFLLGDELHLSERGHDVYLSAYGPEVDAAVRATVALGREFGSTAELEKDGQQELAKIGA
jgi:lysophospholipase L1-like esterase